MCRLRRGCCTSALKCDLSHVTPVTTLRPAAASRQPQWPERVQALGRGGQDDGKAPWRGAARQEGQRGQQEPRSPRERLLWACGISKGLSNLARALGVPPYYSSTRKGDSDRQRLNDNGPIARCSNSPTWASTTPPTPESDPPAPWWISF